MEIQFFWAITTLNGKSHKASFVSDHAPTFTRTGTRPRQVTSRYVTSHGSAMRPNMLPYEVGLNPTCCHLPLNHRTMTITRSRLVQISVCNGSLTIIKQMIPSNSEQLFIWRLCCVVIQGLVCSIRTHLDFLLMWFSDSYCYLLLLTATYCFLHATRQPMKWHKRSHSFSTHDIYRNFIDV